MLRSRFSFLRSWLEDVERKPVIIRGARQVGKTFLVRFLAKECNKHLCEINFEKRPDWASLFSSNDPNQILINLEAAFGKRLDPHSSLLFLDEIQASPEILAKLRWFAEDMPALPVIAAGSLLEFVLEKHHFSMPVGRISYLHLEPMSFEEFLLAKDEAPLLKYLENYQLTVEIPAAIHDKLLRQFREYLIIGGMPAAVQSWITEASLAKVNQIHHDLIATYRDDFAKYRGRLEPDRLEEVMMAIPRMFGAKFVYKHVNASVNTESIKYALELLEKARVCFRTYSCAANALPLGSEIRIKFFKEFFLDVGLSNALLGLTLTEMNRVDLLDIQNGGVAEQVVAQLLRTIVPPYVEPRNFYWHREEKGSNAEVDFLIQHSNKIVPIEVKAGSTGSLKSLHLFMGLKQFPFALRINGDKPSSTQVKVQDHLGNPIQYRLLSCPFYLCGQLHRLLKEIFMSSAIF